MKKKKTSKIAFFSLNRWWLQERRASRAHLAPAKCALRDGKLRKKENIFFLSTQILCGFLFIFKLLPLSHSRRLRRFPSPRLSRCKTFNSAATTSPSLSPASNSIVKTHEEQQNAGLHERAFHRRRQKRQRRRWKIFAFFFFFSLPKESSNLIYYRTMFISHSTMGEWNSPFKYKMHRRRHQAITTVDTATTPVLCCFGGENIAGVKLYIYTLRYSTEWESLTSSKRFWEREREKDSLGELTMQIAARYHSR